MLEHSPQVNSREWWNDYFADQWEAKRGSEQTRHFMQRLLDSLPPNELAWLEAKPRSILDWGCAFGDGVKVMAERFPSGSVAGLDFAATAIEQARKRYPDQNFVLAPCGEIAETFDCIVTSNCLEHFESPLSLAQTHLRSCKYLYIVLVPFDEFPLHLGHHCRFTEEHFPSSLAGFTRLHAGRIEVDRTLWNGQQLLVIYGSPAYLEERQPSILSDRERWRRYADTRLLELQAALADAIASRVATEGRLAQEESAMRQANAELQRNAAIIKARDEAIAWLQSEAKERELQLARFQDLADANRKHENRVAELEAAQAYAARLIAELEAVVAASSVRADQLTRLLAAAQTRIDELQSAIAERDQARQRIAELEADAARRRAVVEAETAKRNGELKAYMKQRDAELASVRTRAGELAAALATREGELKVIKASSSWRLTGPLRRFGQRRPRVARTARLAAKAVWFTVTLQLPAAIRRTIRRRRSCDIISSLGGFHADWYLAQHADVRLAGVHPIAHYVACGAAEGRNPNPMFDTDWYLAQNPDVRAAAINPLAHYLEYGAAEGRDPSPRFDTDWYLATNPDVREAGINPLVHYLEYGAAEGRAPLPKRPEPKPAVRPARPKYDVVILANIDWKARWQRPQQLATQFARNGHRVFYVVAHPNVPDSGARIYDAVPVADDIVQIHFSVACFFDRYGSAVSGGSLAQLLGGFDDLVKDFDIGDAIVHVHLASWTGLAVTLRERWLWRIFYDCMDEWDGFPNIGAEVLAAEIELVRVADVVTVTSPLLMRKWGARARRCEVIRNGVDFSFFHEHCRPNDRFSFPSPVIGYYGAIAEWLDLDLLAELAARNRAWQFVLAGDVFVSDLRGLDRMANVKLLGLRPHGDMPALLWHFDVCLIPFKLNEMTHAVDPVKLYEYLSAGKPVVSVPLKEVEVYRDFISCATGPDEFARAIAAALADRDGACAERRRALAKRNEWSDRYARIHALVCETFSFVSIVIVTYNNRHLTRLCIESILANTTHPAYEIIVVDNNSSDDTKDYLRDVEGRHANVKVVLNADNRGFAAATNQGLKAARGDILIILNNDVVVPRAWLRGLLRCLCDPAIGLVGPVTNAAGNEARIAVSYTDADDMDDFARAHMSGHRGITFDIAVLAMFCLAMRREAFDKIGLLDEGFTVGMFEDDDYANRARGAGYRVVCTEESFVHHAGQAAFKKLIETGQYQAVWDRNQAYYESKWGKWKPHVHRVRT